MIAIESCFHSDLMWWCLTSFQLELVKRKLDENDDNNNNNETNANKSPQPPQPNKSDSFRKKFTIRPKRSTLKLIGIYLLVLLFCYAIANLTNVTETVAYYLKAILLLVSFCFLFRLFYLNLAPLCSSSTQILFYGTISFLSLLGLLLVFIMFFFF